jgi:small-conductance mechanosensitive channel
MPGAFIRFTDFGDSSNFSIIFGQKNYSELKISSDIRIKIFELFKKNSITIPFPQRVVHLK